MTMDVMTPVAGIERFFSQAKRSYPAPFWDESENLWQLVEAFEYSGCNPAFEFDLILQQYDVQQRRHYNHWTCRVDISEVSLTNSQKN